MTPSEICRRLRRRDLEIIFGRVPEGAFDAGLEIGAGDGFQSALLKRCIKDFTCTEINEARFAGTRLDGVEYKIVDATRLDECFEPASFDLIFSSNVFEHLPGPEGIAAKMAPLLKKDGIMVHVMPNGTWKMSGILFFYPEVLRQICRKMFGVSSAREKESPDWDNNPSAGRGEPAALTVAQRIRNKLVPPIHGLARSNIEELLLFREARWRTLFARAGLAVKILPLQFHTPYRFGFTRLGRLARALGLYTSSAYVVWRDGEHPVALNSLLRGTEHG